MSLLRFTTLHLHCCLYSKTPNPSSPHCPAFANRIFLWLFGLESLRGASSKNFIYVRSNRVIRALTLPGSDPGLKGDLPSSFIFQKSWRSGVCTVKVLTRRPAGLQRSWLLNGQLLPAGLRSCPLWGGTWGTGQKLWLGQRLMPTAEQAWP